MKSHRLIFHLKSRIFVRFLSSTDTSFRSFALNLVKELIELNRRSGIFGTNVVWWYAKYAYYRNNQCHVVYCRDGHHAWRNTSMRFCPHYHKLKILSKKILEEIHTTKLQAFLDQVAKKSFFLLPKKIVKV